MALSKIPADLITGGLNVDSAAPADAITVNSSGNVGIGTSSFLDANYPVEIRKDSGNSGLVLHTAGSGGRVGYLTNTRSGTFDIGHSTSNGGTLSFSTSAVGSETLTERMRIDSAGRITMPNQPFFFVVNSGTGSQAGDGITSDPFQFVNAVHNRGNGYNTSTHRFTAPISGVYTFSYNPGYKQTSLNFVCRIKINGSYVTDGIRLIGYPSSHSGGSYSYMRYLSEGDYIELSSEGSTYHRNNSSVPNWFSGILLG